MLIGRIKEQEIITKAILKRKNLFVHGESGVGKTYLVKQVVDNLKDKGVLYSGNCATLKNTLLGLLKYEHDLSFLSRQNILSLKKLFYQMIRGKQPYFVFDHLSGVGPRFYAFFEYLMDLEISFLGVSSGLAREDIGHLGLLLFNFEKMKILNLNKGNTAALIKYYLMARQPRIVLPKEFVKQIFHVSKGNPKIIKQMCLLASESKYQKEAGLDVKLMDLDRRISEVVKQ